MKYDAFISYRHTPLDMEIAKKLHRGLETFIIPPAVRERTGKKKISRVFRDQEELPIGSDLTDKIESALQDSEYLIVVCSPNTPGSDWVRKEIETFIRMHDRSRVLAILIDGEPSDSFPPEILSDENGNPVEPLAADIRGAGRAERNRKFRTELLRLAAPVIGCTFDDLRQRHRERLIRKTIGYAAASALLIAGAGTAFGLYNASVAKQMESLAQEKSSLAGEKMQLALEITQEFRDKQINQSRFYATESMNLLSQGNRKEAALIAGLALPGQEEDRPYVAEAEYALSSALHVYDDGEHRDFYKNLEHELPVSQIWKNENGTRVITLDNGSNIHVWDTDSWEECCVIPPDILEDNYINDILVADADENGIYILSEAFFSAYDASGDLLYRIDRPERGSYLSGTICPAADQAFLTDGSAIKQVRLSDGSITASFDNGRPEFFNKKQGYNASSGLFINGHSSPEEGSAAITVLDTASGSCRDIMVTGSSILQFCITEAGNIAVLSCDADYIHKGTLSPVHLDLFSPEGEKYWTHSFDPEVHDLARFSSILRPHSYPQGGEQQRELVCILEDTAFTFDEQDGSEVMHMSLTGNTVSLLLSSTSRGGFIAYDNGNIHMADLKYGQLLPENENQYVPGLREVLAVNNAFVVRAIYDKSIHVLSYQKAFDLEELPDTENAMVTAGTSPDSSFYVMLRSDATNTFVFFDADGNRICDLSQRSYQLATAFCGNTFVIADKDGLRMVDPASGTTEEYDYSELGIDASMLNQACFSQNGEYVALWSGKDLYVADVKNRCCIYRTNTEETIGSAVPSEDGASLFISEKNHDLYITDIADGSIRNFADTQFQQVSDYYGQQYLCVSRNSRYAAMCCKDQRLWILDTQTKEVSGGLPMQLIDGSFLAFSEDERYLFLQGHDHVFRIWDIQKEEYIKSFTTDVLIKYAVLDAEDGKLALISGHSLYLLDTQDYGVCAYVPDCVAYLRDRNAFIQYSSGHVYRCCYKDYRTLLEETERQFPGAALTGEQKVEYNID